VSSVPCWGVAAHLPDIETGVYDKQVTKAMVEFMDKFKQFAQNSYSFELSRCERKL